MMNQDYRMGDAMLSGMAGAVAVTAVHEAARRVSSDAPRMDVVAMRALARATDAADLVRPGDDALHKAALAGELVCNSAYYAFATTWTRGVVLGLGAGIGALLLPQSIGLGAPPRSDRLSNQLMTVAWYLVGGLAAAATATCLANRRQEAAQDFAGVH
jgi:hypothetical protein